MLKLRLPDEVIGEKAVLEEQGREQEVRAVPMEGPLDPVLETAVESQPVVQTPPKIDEDSKADEDSLPPPPRRHKPAGFLLALGAGALVVAGVLLGGANGNGNASAGAGANAPKPPSPTPGGSSSLWE